MFKFVFCYFLKKCGTTPPEKIVFLQNSVIANFIIAVNSYRSLEGRRRKGKSRPPNFLLNVIHDQMVKRPLDKQPFDCKIIVLNVHGNELPTLRTYHFP